MEPDQLPNKSNETSSGESQPMGVQQPFTPQQSPATQPSPFQSNPGVTPSNSTPNGMAPQHKKKTWLWIVAAVVAIAVICAVMLLLNYHNSAAPAVNSGNSTTTTAYSAQEDSALAMLKKEGSSITSSSLGSINKADLFYAVFRNAAKQPIVTTTKNMYWTTDLNGTPLVSGESNAANITQTGYNYTNGQFSYQSSVTNIVDKCVGGVDYFMSLDSPSTWAKSPNGNGNCQVATTPATINDSLNTGGLNNTQAQKFADSLRNINGLISVTDASLVTVQGKPYVRLDVSVNAKTDCYSHSIASGTGCFKAEFDNLGLSKSWPFTPEDSPVTGAQFAYFVDPSSQLPAYMQIAYTPVLASQANWQNQQIVYDFGALPVFQLTNNSPDPATISWPIAQL